MVLSLEPASGGQVIQHPLDQKIMHGADVAIALADAQGWLILGITNQGGVAAGKKSLEECVQEQYYTLELIPKLHKILFCPDYEGKQLGVVYRGFHNVITPSGYSSFRKPEPGMIEYALAATHDIDECLYVGDRPEDKQAIASAGIKFLWADAWRTATGELTQLIWRVDPANLES